MKNSIKTGDIRSALALLNGGDVISKDRRAADATPIDFEKTRNGKTTTIRTCYGISNRMHLRLTALASSVEFIGGRPNYNFVR